MTIEPNDELTRFIRPKQKKYVTKDGQMRTAAFSAGQDGKISVFVTTDMSLNSIWEHGDSYFPHEIIGRAYLLANIVFDEGLGVDFDNIPPKHANIVGFPEEKELSLAKRQALAINSAFDKK